jgi:lipopolysaccharide biosynthesis glycosyltransferase
LSAGGAERIEIACAARRDYLPHAATMLASAAANTGGPVRAHLLVGADVESEAREAVVAMGERGGAEIVAVAVEEDEVAALKTTPTFPTAHWYRVLLPELLELPRVIYLDSDTLVLDSLLPLWRTELGDSLLAAVTNVFPDEEAAARLTAGLGVELGAYFNSGVMLLDLESLRSAEAPQRVIAYAAANHERLFLPEQDAMNAVLAGRRLPLAPRWNAMVALERLGWSRELFGAEAVREALEDPAIRHFEGSGSNKPWHPEADADARHLYAGFRARTPWPLPDDG